jgi:hypothetical protein
MAIIENPVIGKASGTIGNTVLYTLCGQNIWRTKAFNPKNPKTPGQLAVRGRFKELQDLIRPVLVYINQAYADSRTDMSPYNHIMSINNPHCFISDTNEIDPAKFVLCENDGSFVANIVLTSTVADTITVTFDSNAQNDDEDSDPVKAFGLDISGNKIWKFEQESVRSTGTITLTQPEMSGLDIAVYLECLDRVNLLMDKPKHVIKYVGTLKVQ